MNFTSFPCLAPFAMTTALRSLIAACIIIGPGFAHGFLPPQLSPLSFRAPVVPSVFVSCSIEDNFLPVGTELAQASSNEWVRLQTEMAVPSPTEKRQSRAKTRRKKNKVNGRVRATGPTNPISEDDIGHHVAAQYINGPGGMIKGKYARRQQMEAKSAMMQDCTSPLRQIDYLKDLDRHPALVLNADYQPMGLLPLSLWRWQDSVKAIFAGKVTVVDTYPDVAIRAVNMNMPLPSVIALNDYVSKTNQNPAFTRRNVFLRDSYRCQYCGKHFKTHDLTLDHYVPRSMGGRLEWSNVVTSCRKCNSRKGSVPPHKLRSIGMKVINEPRVPTQWELAAVAGKMMPRRVHPTWEPYLGFVADFVSDSQTQEGKETFGDVLFFE